MRRIIAVLALLCLLLSACTARTEPKHDPDKLSIVCSCFPAYDFAREIAGEEAELTLLLKPGTEVHAYEPSPRDVARIETAELFICNGGESEAWVESLISPEKNAVYMMDCVDAVEESNEGIYASGEEHEHDHDHEHEHDHDHEHEHEEEEELDEHVWTSPLNAIKISEEICKRLCELKPESAELLTANLNSFKAELMRLDADFRSAVASAGHGTLIFADRFPMRYFTLEYGLEYYAAFPGCAAQTEPSAKTVAFLIDRVREDAIPAVLYMEFSNERMADVICEDTGAKKLPFYSAHSVTAEQFESGIGYLELMRINLSSLKEALK